MIFGFHCNDLLAALFIDLAPTIGRVPLGLEARTFRSVGKFVAISQIGKI